jgi:hypothetical protein
MSSIKKLAKAGNGMKQVASKHGSGGYVLSQSEVN